MAIPSTLLACRRFSHLLPPTVYLLPTGLLLYIIVVVRNSQTYTITHTQELVDISHGVRRCDDDDDDDDDDSDDSDVLMGEKRLVSP